MRGVCRDWRLGLNRAANPQLLDGGVDQVGPRGPCRPGATGPPPLELRTAPLPGWAAVDVLEPVMPLQAAPGITPGGLDDHLVYGGRCQVDLLGEVGDVLFPLVLPQRCEDLADVPRRPLRETSSIPPMRSLDKHIGTSMSPEPSRLGSGHTRVRPPGRPTGGRERSTTGPSYTASVSVRGPGPRARTGQRRGARVGATGRTRCRQLAGGRARVADRDRAAPLLRRGRRAAQPAGHGGAGCRRRRPGADGVPRRRGGGPGGGRRRVGVRAAQMGQVASQNIHS
jgi:hypothetical protein